jgi:hypothetical protein
MRLGLPSSVVASIGKLGERSGRGGRGLSLLPPHWGQVVQNVPTTLRVAPKFSSWLGFGLGQGLPPPSSQHVHLFVSWITFFFLYFLRQPSKTMHGGWEECHEFWILLSMMFNKLLSRLPMEENDFYHWFHLQLGVCLLICFLFMELCWDCMARI